VYFCVLFIVCFVTLPVLFVCKCVLNNCHRVATQFQLNISYIKNLTTITVIDMKTNIHVWSSLTQFFLEWDMFENKVIIIIIWHYSPLWGFAFLTKFLLVILSLAVSFQFLTFSFSFRSSMTSSCHRCFGLPTGLGPIGFQSSSFPVGLPWSILWICPSHLILCVLMKNKVIV